MRGLADGCACGVTVQQIRRVHMIGELTKGACSMFGAWGDATADGGTLQLRCARARPDRAPPPPPRPPARTEAAGCCASVRRAVH